MPYKFFIFAAGVVFMCGVNIWSSVERIDEAEVFSTLEEEGIYVPYSEAPLTLPETDSIGQEALLQDFEATGNTQQGEA